MSAFEDLLGKTLVEISGVVGGDEVTFITADGHRYRLYHSQDCCEDVSIEDIAGDLASLVGEPLTLAEESTSNENLPGVTPEYQDSFTWTFYRLATEHGFATIRWYGESNGYYSERVDFEELSQATG